jgi:rfaE bifunctional protein kinase chain/domain
MSPIAISSFHGARVLIVGDVMLDRYWFGEVTRISPEAPVPVVRVVRTEDRPGGATNVARNVAALGARATVLSVTGNDDGCVALERLMQEAGVVCRLFRDETIRTTVKIRVIGVQQQLLRVDFEEEPDHEILLAKLDEYRAALADHDVVILSDYGKGGLRHVARMIEMARAAGKPVFIDPKGDDYSKYVGATMITPNRAELVRVVGRWKDEEDLAVRAESLRRELGLDHLLLTRSEEGMTLFSDGGRVDVKANAREVFDVSGAGDTVIAVLATAVSSGMAMVDAVRLANAAGGIVVGKMGTAVVTLDELEVAAASLHDA